MDTRFHDYVSLKQYQVPQHLRNKFLDKVLSSMERQKDEVAPEEVKGLQVKARVTHSARLTGHHHYYGPMQVRQGMDSFTKPYKKPILAHHDEQKDAIGRVQSAVYIPTPCALIPESVQDAVDNLVVYDKKALQTIRKIKSFLYDKRFEGLGYVESVANILDPTAIEKVIDGRYHTISVGYGTDSLVCSHCGQDWLRQGICEHEKGVDYGSGPMFLMFGDMTYDEWSYVNTPADSLAANEEVRKITIPVLTDALSKITSVAEKKNMVLQMMAADSLHIDNPERVPITNVALYVYDQDSDSFIPQYSEQTKINGDKMKLKDLYSLPEGEVYKTISEKLPEDKRLSEDSLAKLEDSKFLGRGRTFPVVDIEHIDAVKTLLESVEDSDEKTELLGFLDERRNAIGVPAETTDAQAEEPKADEPKAEETTDSAKTEAEGKDEVSYSFSISAGGGAWSCPENADPEAEKAILQLLLSMYAREKKDALEVINKVLEISVDNKDALISELSKDSLEKVSDLEARIDNYKKELQIWKDSETTLNVTVAHLTEELKDMYVDNLVKFQDKQDPDKTVEQLKDEFKGQPLNELRATVKNMDRLFGSSKEDVPEKVDNKTLGFADGGENKDAVEITEEEIQDQERNIYLTYQDLSRKNADAANNYLTKQTARLNKLKDSLKKQKDGQDK